MSKPRRWSSLSRPIPLVELVETHPLVELVVTSVAFVAAARALLSRPCRRSSASLLSSYVASGADDPANAHPPGQERPRSALPLRCAAVDRANRWSSLSRPHRWSMVHPTAPVQAAGRVKLRPICRPCRLPRRPCLQIGRSLARSRQARPAGGPARGLDTLDQRVRRGVDTLDHRGLDKRDQGRTLSPPAWPPGSP